MAPRRGVRRETLINALRQQGCSFKRSAKNVDLWKNANKTKFTVPRGNIILESAARIILRDALCNEAWINKFINEYCADYN